MNKMIISSLHTCAAMIIVLSIASCKKEKHPPAIPDLPSPEMEYFNFNNREIKAGIPGFAVDLNHDGRNDIAFSTLLVGDPIYQVDKLEFLVETNIKANLAVNAEEEIPLMNTGDSIVSKDFGSYHWYELSSIMLVQKVISFTQPPVWQGHWKNAVHKYLPYQVVVGNDVFNGWVELSVDVDNERVVLHKAAICKQPNTTIKAGM